VAAPEEPTRPCARRSIPGGRAAVFTLGERIQPSDIGKLCEALRLLLEGSSCEVVICDVGAVPAPDAATIDALARLQLTARRLGGRVLLLRPGEDVLRLLDLMGLTEVVPLCLDLPVEPGRQSEHRKEPPRLEKEGDAGDPTAR
jgi:anti-anti-sigma regulatory factor